MTSQNPELVTTLDDAVEEVLASLTGLDLSYDPRSDRYRAIVRCLNRALRKNAFEQEWSYYSDVESLGPVIEGVDQLVLDISLRPRIIGDDAIRLVDENGQPLVWAYILPRDALHKYRNRGVLRASVVRNSLLFSRPFRLEEAGLDIQVPVMREPLLFHLPDLPEDGSPVTQVPDEIRQQPVDFAWPDLIITRAAYLYAQTDPIMQPRVQTLEGEWKDLMYQCIERDTSNTDTPYMNEWHLPVESSLHWSRPAGVGPHADGWQL